MRLEGKCPKNISYDAWLSGVMGRDVYKLTVDESFMSAVGLVNFYKLHADVFFYAKVAVDDIAAARFLEEQGFRLIDTNVLLEKPIERGATHSCPGVLIRLAQPQDKDKVKALAGGCFCFSRFHLDPAVPKDMANKIKAEWAGNFFAGKRGECLVVAQKGRDIVGFLQLLDDRKGMITIDLIGVAAGCRQQGIGAAMVDFAQAHFSRASKITVGTQIANVASLRCYEKLGFRHVQAWYVFHYHG
ncbi:MAG: GNAT family N-acetyltransferase [Candidatus Omnitrophota bacterium]